MNALDCNDQDSLFHPNIPEVCDGLDNNCDDNIDEGLILNRFYLDEDNDGYGVLSEFLDTCGMVAPFGYVSDSTDCDDSNVLINPGAIEIANNGVDEDCLDGDLISGIEELNRLVVSLFPNPFNGYINIESNLDSDFSIVVKNLNGVVVATSSFKGKSTLMNLTTLESGVYIISVWDKDGNWTNRRLVRM